LAFNNFVLFDRVHLPILGKRAAVVEEDLLSVREPDRCGFALISDALPFGPGCGTASLTQSAMQSATQSFTAAHMML
jgi:hypothetical protein